MRSIGLLDANNQRLRNIGLLFLQRSCTIRGHRVGTIEGPHRKRGRLQLSLIMLPLKLSVRSSHKLHIFLFHSREGLYCYVSNRNITPLGNYFKGFTV